MRGDVLFVQARAEGRVRVVVHPDVLIPVCVNVCVCMGVRVCVCACVRMGGCG